MKDLLLQHAKSQVEDVRQITKSRRWKMIYGIGFLLGFLLFAILGKNLVMERGLLDVDSLREVKDAMIDKSAFLKYVFRRRLLWLLAGILAWWWGFAKWYIYGILGGYGFVMGACLQTVIMRYGMKGIMLWIFLYFPQVIFYAGVLFCGIVLVNRIPDRVGERWPALKWGTLMQNGLILLCMIGLYALGIYCEGYLNVVLLQNYLQFF